MQVLHSRRQILGIAAGAFAGLTFGAGCKGHSHSRQNKTTVSLGGEIKPILEQGEGQSVIIEVRRGKEVIHDWRGNARYTLTKGAGNSLGLEGFAIEEDLIAGRAANVQTIPVYRGTWQLDISLSVPKGKGGKFEDLTLSPKLFNVEQLTPTPLEDRFFKPPTQVVHYSPYISLTTDDAFSLGITSWKNPTLLFEYGHNFVIKEEEGVASGSTIFWRPSKQIPGPVRITGKGIDESGEIVYTRPTFIKAVTEIPVELVPIFPTPTAFASGLLNLSIESRGESAYGPGVVVLTRPRSKDGEDNGVVRLILPSTTDNRVSSVLYSPTIAGIYGVEALTGKQIDSYHAAPFPTAEDMPEQPLSNPRYIRVLPRPS